MLEDRDVLLGRREPRVRSVPPYVSTTGPEAIDLCRKFGLTLDPWQADLLTDALGERVDGTWAAVSVGNVVARQNGKSEIIIARMLAGLFLLEEEEIIYSSHRADTSMKIFQRFVKYLKRNRTVRGQIDTKSIKVVNTHGQEGVVLPSGQSVGFRTRAQEGGRGFSADCIFFDEAFELAEDDQAAILPTFIAKRNPQVWYVGTPVDQETHRNGVVFSRIRQQGLACHPRTAFFEWSVDGDLSTLDRDVLDDPLMWAEANPSLGYQANEETILICRGSMKARKFATECLCIGDWPDVEEGETQFISQKAWEGCADAMSKISGRVTYGIDVSPQRDWATVFAAGARADGAPHVEIVARKRNTEWVVDKCEALRERHGFGVFVIDEKSQAAQLIPEFEEAGFEVHSMKMAEYVAACAEFYDAVLLANHDDPVRRDKRLRYPDPQLELSAAVAAAATRPVGDGAWAWSRRKADSDITALVGASIALWGAEHLKPEEKGQLAASMEDYDRRHGIKTEEDRANRMKELLERHNAKVEAVVKKAKQ